MTDQARRDRATTHDAARPASGGSHRYVEEDVDDASEASFPASDPPAWMSLRVGGPPARRGEGSEQRSAISGQRNTL